jgi:hypothetical protein
MLNGINSGLTQAVTLARTAGTGRDDPAAFDSQVAANQQVIDTVAQAVSQARGGRKSIARSRLDQIKMRIDLLSRFAGDDASRRRELARLARELKSVASGYADSSASGPLDTLQAAAAPAVKDATATTTTDSADDGSFANDVRAAARRLKAMLDSLSLSRKRRSSDSALERRASADLADAQSSVGVNPLSGMPAGMSILV